jgi:uncharacterized protein
VTHAADDSAPFIFPDSFSGICGLFVKGIHFAPELLSWIVVVVAAGEIGSDIGSWKLSFKDLRCIPASVLGMT